MRPKGKVPALFGLQTGATVFKSSDMTLDACRQKIDELDREIVRLLNERIRTAFRIGRLKHEDNAPVYVLVREIMEKVLDEVEKGNAQYGVIPIENSIEGGVTPPTLRTASRKHPLT